MVHFKNKEKGMKEDTLENRFTVRYENEGRDKERRFFEESDSC
jgi:hypothetical protein